MKFDPFRKILLPALLSFPMVFSGCFKDHRNFKDWYFNAGTPFMRMVKKDERPKIYGHFQLPQVLWQPAGGRTTPGLDYTRNTGGYRSRSKDVEVSRSGKTERLTITESYYEPGESYGVRSRRGKYDPQFVWMNGGALDFIPYRVWTATDLDIDQKLGWTVGQPLMMSLMWTIGLMYRVPVYASMDAYKTLMTPVAYFHYKKKR